MAARRPRTPKLETPIEAEAPPSPAAESASSANRYASIRIIKTAGKIRFSTSANLIEANDDQTITFVGTPFPHFLVMPGGTQIPLSNVSAAVPVQSQIAEKLSRKERLAKRAANLEAKMGERAMVKAATAESAPKVRSGVQEVPIDEDDLDDSLGEDEIDGTGEEVDDE